MKCNNCGAELQEGKLYCEKCGEEIKIVPEFDLEFDNQINQTIVNIAQDVFENQTSDVQEQSEPLQKDSLQETKEFQKTVPQDESLDITQELIEDFRDILPKNKINLTNMSRKMIIIILSCICVFILCLIIVISFHKHSNVNTYELQYKDAINYANNGDYADAVTAMEKALALNPDNADAQYLLANYYYQSDNGKSAVILLRELILKNPENIDDCYDSLISIYSENQEYQEIADLLSDCRNDVILSKYSEYLASEPIFSIKDGEYDKVMSLTLSSSSEGTIHYTLDNSIPNRYATVYDTPILLESGKYTVKAIFTNKYGIDSEIKICNYKIEIEPPDVPQINIESGTYDKPRLIEVIYSPDTKVYYTTDGSIPDADSLRYTEPLEMPVGNSNFHFVAINEAGAASEIEQRSFQVSMESYLAPDMALQVLKNNLQVNGIILNPEGNVPEKLGHNTYVVHTAVVINDAMYYIIVENYVDTTGSIHQAQSYYAIDAVTGDPYYAWKIGEGQYTLREF